MINPPDYALLMAGRSAGALTVSGSENPEQFNQDLQGWQMLAARMDGIEKQLEEIQFRIDIMEGVITAAKNGGKNHAIY